MGREQDKKPITAESVAADIARIAEEVERLSKHPTPEELKPLIIMLREMEEGLNGPTLPGSVNHRGRKRLSGGMFEDIEAGSGVSRDDLEKAYQALTEEERGRRGLRPPGMLPHVPRLIRSSQRVDPEMQRFLDRWSRTSSELIAAMPDDSGVRPQPLSPSSFGRNRPRVR